MNAVSIGPFAFSVDRLAVILGIITFLVMINVLASRIDRRLAHWSSAALVIGLVSARVGHVIVHLDNFFDEPWRVFAVWQGGFSWIGGIAGVLLTLYLLSREGKTALPWAALSLASGAFVWIAITQLVGGHAGPSAPVDQYAQLNGPDLSIAARRGRPVVINLWASWCPPCRREMPMMALAEKLNPETDFIFANQGESRQAIEGYLQKEGITLDTVVLDQFSQLSRHYSAPGLPATLFIGAEGQLVTSHLGEISQEALATAITELKTMSNDKDDE